LGCMLTLADPRLGDAGLAIAVMAPILASLVGRKPLRHQSWALLAGVVGLAGIGAAFAMPAIPVGAGALMATAIVAFVTSVAIIAHTANRINAAYEVYDKAQMTAYRHLIEHVQDGVIRF